MRLWIIERPGPDGWEDTDAALIRAETEQQAREIAGGLEPREHWGSPGVTCEPIRPDGEPRIIVKFSDIRG